MSLDTLHVKGVQYSEIPKYCTFVFVISCFQGRCIGISEAKFTGIDIKFSNRDLMAQYRNIDFL